MLVIDLKNKTIHVSIKLNKTKGKKYINDKLKVKAKF